MIVNCPDVEDIPGHNLYTIPPDHSNIGKKILAANRREGYLLSKQRETESERRLPVSIVSKEIEDDVLAISIVCVLVWVNVCVSRGLGLCPATGQRSSCICLEDVIGSVRSLARPRGETPCPITASVRWERSRLLPGSLSAKGQEMKVRMGLIHLVSPSWFNLGSELPASVWNKVGCKVTVTTP